MRNTLRTLLCTAGLRALHAIAFCCIAVATGAAASPLAPVVELHEAQDNTGLAVLMQQGDTVIDELYVGSADLGWGIAVDENTRFQVMSITKAVVAAALVKVMSEGKLAPDTRVSDVLPDYPGEGADQITVAQLAGHLAGLAHRGHPDRKDLYVRHFETATAALETFQDLPLQHAPGSAYAYSSSNFNLLAAMLEAVEGKPLDDVLRERVLDPLGMSATAPGNVLQPQPNVARHYSWIDVWSYAPVDTLQQVPTWDFSYNGGGGNLITTARDLARLGAALVAPGFFTERELALLTTPVDADQSGWAYGWVVTEDESGRRLFRITGATPGVQAGLLVWPDDELVVVALANAWGKGSAGGDLVITAPQQAGEAWLGSQAGTAPDS